MTHEPECNVLLVDEWNRPRFGAMPPTFNMPPDTGWCNCDAIRAAYQRGRRDAANDVADMKPYILITVIDEQRAYVSKSEAYGEALGSEK